MMEQENKAIFIRSDGWVFTEDGIRRLKESGLRGKMIAERKIDEKIGRRFRIRRPIDRSAFDLVSKVKGVVPRAVFVSTAIVEQSRKGRDAVQPTAADDPITYMWFTLTEDAHRVVENMGRADFRRFVSTAIRKAAKRRGVA